MSKDEVCELEREKRLLYINVDRINKSESRSF